MSANQAVSIALCRLRRARRHHDQYLQSPQANTRPLCRSVQLVGRNLQHSTFQLVLHTAMPSTGASCIRLVASSIGMLLCIMSHSVRPRLHVDAPSITRSNHQPGIMHCTSSIDLMRSLGAVHKRGCHRRQGSFSCAGPGFIGQPRPHCLPAAAQSQRGRHLPAQRRLHKLSHGRAAASRTHASDCVITGRWQLLPGGLQRALPSALCCTVSLSEAFRSTADIGSCAADDVSKVRSQPATQGHPRRLARCRCQLLCLPDHA